ncbi:hypothetical protein KRP22_010251 [Phytophthora ramorum]|nr:Heat stress transcription factor C-1b [Phytophthora ramorum]
MRMLSSVPGTSLDKLPTGVSFDAPKPREVAPFLRSLRRMLENESDEVLRWTPDGRAFEILDMARMQDEVLPKYFKHRKYTSFQRQLNYFSFKKPDLAWRITRKKSVHTHGSSTPRKPRPAATSSAAANTLNVKLEPVKLEPQQLSSWKRDIAIHVPNTLLFGGAFGNGRPFPSPTDMDMMLMEHDVEPHRCYQLGSSLAPPTLSEQDVDSLEWIDNFLPSLDAAPRQDEPVFAGNTVNVSAGALMRQTPHYVFPSLQPPPGGDYTCLASM